MQRVIALDIKVCNDAGKTMVPFDDFLTCGKAFQKALRPYLPATGLSRDRGFNRRLELAARHEQAHDMVRALLT